MYNGSRDYGFSDAPLTTGLWTFSRRPLHRAYGYGFLKTAARLLKEDASKVNDSNYYGETPIYRACHNGHMEIVKFLLEKGAVIENATIDGFTPLFIMCHKGNLDFVRFLVENEADLNKADNNGWTPHFMACQEGHEEIARILVEFLR